MSGTNSISYEQLATYLQGDVVETDFATWKDLFVYQGFDPKSFIQLLWAKAEKAGLTRDQFYSDLRKFCVIVLLRGTGWFNPKFNARTDPKGVAEITVLKNRYEVKQNNDPRTLKKDDVIVSRVVNSVPWVLAGLLARGYGRVVGKIPGDFPRFYCFPGAAAIISREQPQMFAAYMEWSRSFDGVINASKPTGNDRLQQIAKAAHNSNWVPEAERQSTFETLLVIQKNRNVPNKETTEKS